MEEEEDDIAHRVRGKASLNEGVERQRVLAEKQSAMFSLDDFEEAGFPRLGRRAPSVSDDGECSQLLMLQRDKYFEWSQEDHAYLK